MLNEFFGYLGSSGDFIVSLVIFFIGIPIVFSFLFKKISQRNQLRLMASWIIKMLLDVLVFSIIFVVFSVSTKSSMENLNLFLLVTLVYSLSLNFSMSADVRESLLKSKRTEGFYDSLKTALDENKTKVLGIFAAVGSVFLFIFVLGNGIMLSFMILFFASTFICSCTSAFAYPLIAKLSERTFK